MPALQCRGLADCRTTLAPRRRFRQVIKNPRDLCDRPPITIAGSPESVSPSIDIQNAHPGARSRRARAGSTRCTRRFAAERSDRARHSNRSPIICAPTLARLNSCSDRAPICLQADEAVHHGIRRRNRIDKVSFAPGSRRPQFPLILLFDDRWLLREPYRASFPHTTRLCPLR